MSIFENLDIKNKADFVNFIKQLKAALAPHGMVVTVDVSGKIPILIGPAATIGQR